MPARNVTQSFLLIVVLVGRSIAANAALPMAHPGPTVNDYTAAESGRAQAAARRAGYSITDITMVQAGYFFLKGEKAGESYFLTVTPEGKVYASAPLSEGRAASG